jgi:hypothetical protein
MQDVRGRVHLRVDMMTQAPNRRSKRKWIQLIDLALHEGLQEITFPYHISIQRTSTANAGGASIEMGEYLLPIKISHTRRKTNRRWCWHRFFRRFERGRQAVVPIIVIMSFGAFVIMTLVDDPLPPMTNLTSKCTCQDQNDEEEVNGTIKR